MQNALENASVVAGWGGVEDGCEFVGDVYRIRGKTNFDTPCSSLDRHNSDGSHGLKWRLRAVTLGQAPPPPPQKKR
jgi:hypothetical protein